MRIGAKVCTFPGCSQLALYPAKWTKPDVVVTARATRCYTHRPRPPARKPARIEESDMPRFKPNRDLLEEAAALPYLAKDVTAALEHIAREFAIADSLPTQTPGAAPPIQRFYASCAGKGGVGVENGQVVQVAPCPGCDLCQPQLYTPVERAALARLRLSRNGEQLRDDIAAYRALRLSISIVATQTMGMRIPVEVKRCDGSEFEGADLVWTPHSRDPGNGWFDPTCTDAADLSGLCPARCRPRERRWRNTNGLAPREHNASVAAA